MGTNHWATGKVCLSPSDSVVQGFWKECCHYGRLFPFFFFFLSNKNIETFRLFISVSVPLFSNQSCYLSDKVGSPDESTSMHASHNRRCKNPSSEKQGKQEPCRDFIFCTHLLWLGECGPEKECWFQAMMYFFHSQLAVVQPHPGLVEGC